jgi:hypothetical protein
MLEGLLQWSENQQVNFSLMWEELLFDMNNFLQDRGKQIDYLEKVEYIVDSDEIIITPDWIMKAYPDVVESLHKDLIDFMNKRVEERVNGTITLRH